MSRIKGASAVWLVRYGRRGLLGVLVALSLLMPSLALAEMLTGTFLGKDTGREVAFQHQGQPHNDWAGVLKFKLDDGPDVSVFCIQINVRVSTGDRYRSDGPVLALPNGCQIRYLLDKYPAATVGGDADEAAARQLAIWVFSDNVDPMTIQDVKIRDRTNALVNEARLGACPLRRTAAPDLRLDPATTSSAAGQPVAYTVQAGALDAGQTLSASVAGPAVLTDASGAGSGQRQNVTLDGQGQANFWVTGTGAGQVTVRVDLSYRLEAGTVFSQLDDNAPSQRLVMAESRVLANSATAQVAIAAGAPPPSPAPPQPTDRPSRPPKPATTPAPPEQSTEQPTAISGEQATAIPTPASVIPGAAPEAGGQLIPVSQSAPAAAAGGAAQPLPISLPNTATSDAPLGWVIVTGVVLLSLGAWLLRRRITR